MKAGNPEPRTYSTVLSMIYRIAIRNGKVSHNPFRLVPTMAANNERVRFLSVEEEKKLRAGIMQKFPEHLPEFELALHSGLRLCEQYTRVGALLTGSDES